jgi:hypothetical protein
MGERLLIEIERFNEAEATRLAREHPDWFRGGGRESTDVRANEIRARVYLKIWECFEIQVKNRNAARWVKISY